MTHVQVEPHYFKEFFYLVWNVPHNLKGKVIRQHFLILFESIQFDEVHEIAIQFLLYCFTHEFVSVFLVLCADFDYDDWNRDVFGPNNFV